MRAGDRVRHKFSGETWVLAYATETYVSWCGWPEGLASRHDVELVQVATDAEHREMLEAWAAKKYDDRRAHVCRHQLYLLNQAFVGMYI